MKYLTYSIISVCIIFMWVAVSNKLQKAPFVSPTGIPVTSAPRVSIVPTKAPHVIVFHTQPVAYDILEVAPVEPVLLIANFKEKELSSTLKKTHNCKAMVNGGFYDTSDRPLGMFASTGITLRKNVSNSLINGYLWENTKGHRFIDITKPKVPVSWALQTGPILIQDKRALPLRIRNDEYARRIVAVLGENSSLSFLALYNPASHFEGPLLAEVPEIIKEIENKQGLRILHAINLDGGTASTFQNDSITLSELSAVGSVFCLPIKK